LCTVSARALNRHPQIGTTRRGAGKSIDAQAERVFGGSYESQGSSARQKPCLGVFQWAAAHAGYSAATGPAEPTWDGGGRKGYTSCAPSELGSFAAMP
jgi:hypothetical protein